MKLFTSLVLDGAGVILEPIDVPAETVVFHLQNLHLLLKLLCIAPLMLERGKAVLTEYDVISHGYRQHPCRHSRGFAPVLKCLGTQAR